MSDNHARLSPALVETIAGLAAGTASTLAVHPLDVIKTRLQSIYLPASILWFYARTNRSLQFIASPLQLQSTASLSSAR